MSAKNRLLVFLITITLVTGRGCRDNEPPGYDYQAIWKCHHENTLTYKSTKEKIVGLWEWKYVECCNDTPLSHPSNKESNGLKIQFNPNGTGTLTDGNSVTEFNWDIQIKDNDLYGFQTAPMISQLQGRLLFCDDIMLCNNSYVDGADNFLQKN